MVAIGFAIGPDLIAENSAAADTFAVEAVRPGMVHDQSFASADVPFQAVQPMPTQTQSVQQTGPTLNRERIVAVLVNAVQTATNPLDHYKLAVEEGRKKRERK